MVLPCVVAQSGQFKPSGLPLSGGWGDSGLDLLQEPYVVGAILALG